MRSAGSPDNSPAVVPPKGTGDLRSVARRPILDLRGRVHAFKLRFRGESSPCADGQPPSKAMRETAVAFGLEKPSELKKLTGALLAFVNCPPADLGEDLAQVLPPTLTVLEITTGLELPPDLIPACEKLKALGFRFALDDFSWQKQLEPLLQVADYILVDFAQTDAQSRRELLAHLRGQSINIVAKNVETLAEYQQACEEGFTLFEGFYFCQPAATTNRRPPANQVLRIEILQALQKRPMDLTKLSELVKRDGPLAYQLLKLVNSPLMAIREPVQSIRAALIVVGEDAFRRIATLAIATQFNGNQPAELLCMALVRGRFCELGAVQLSLDPFAQYLLGLLSLMPAMQGQPMKEIAATLPLSDEIRAALLGTKNRERALLDWLEHCERGDWAGCDGAAQASGLNQSVLSKAYVDAVAWAEATLHSVV